MISGKDALKAKRFLAEYCDEHQRCDGCVGCVFVHWHDFTCDCEFDLCPCPQDWEGLREEDYADAGQDEADAGAD